MVKRGCRRFASMRLKKAWKKRENCILWKKTWHLVRMHSDLQNKCHSLGFRVTLMIIHSHLYKVNGCSDMLGISSSCSWSTGLLISSDCVSEPRKKMLFVCKFYVLISFPLSWQPSHSSDHQAGYNLSCYTFHLEMYLSIIKSQRKPGTSPWYIHHSGVPRITCQLSHRR